MAGGGGRTRLLLALALVTGTLAGCLGGDGADSAAPAAPGAGEEKTTAGAPSYLGYENCSGIEVVHPVDHGEAAALMPPGFRPRPFLDQPGADRATFVTQVGVCDEVHADGHSVANSTRIHGFAILLAYPPEEHRDPDIRLHAITLHFVVGGDEELALLEAGGLTTGSVGQGAVDVIRGPDAGVVVDGWLDAGAFALDSRGTGGTVETAPGYNVRFYDVSGAPAFDARLRDFPLSVGAGASDHGDMPVTTAGAGYVVLRLPDGPFVEFHPVT